MRTYGVPEEILTDNGKVFAGPFNHPPVKQRGTPLDPPAAKVEGVPPHHLM